MSMLWTYPNSNQCGKCGRILNVNSFNIMNKMELQHWCRDCTKQACIEWRRENPDRHAAGCKKWWNDNPGASSEYKKQYNKTHPNELRFRVMAYQAKKQGLIPESDHCNVCGTYDEDIDLHHYCYDPGWELIVLPCCRACHIRAHGGSFKYSKPVGVEELLQ